MAASLFSATHYSIKPRHKRAHQRTWSRPYRMATDYLPFQATVWWDTFGLYAQHG
jgi:hypothetical protein